MMLTIHSLWAYLVLSLVLLAVINAISGVSSKRDFKDKDLRLSLFALIVTHLQLIIGLGWYFMSPWYKSMKESGINDGNRLLAVEHPFFMILAIILMTIGWSKHKKKDSDNSKFKIIAIFYGLALVLILSRIPWSNWFN
jgi:Na+/H+-dicarboxylate symporter